jgi:hypothetical protein
VRRGPLSRFVNENISGVGKQVLYSYDHALLRVENKAGVWMCCYVPCWVVCVHNVNLRCKVLEISERG